MRNVFKHIAITDDRCTNTYTGNINKGSNNTGTLSSAFCTIDTNSGNRTFNKLYDSLNTLFAIFGMMLAERERERERERDPNLVTYSCAFSSLFPKKTT
jgi:hypothetical protein